MADDIRVLKVFLSEMPHNCGKCPLMGYIHDATPVCYALPKDVWDIAGNPYDMKYRRSDCPAVVDLEF